MPSLLKAAKSQVGRKILTGITGVGLMLFIVGHLAGNLTLFGEAQLFNEYTLKLESLGVLLYIIEAGLVLFFGMHAYIGIDIWLKKRKARGSDYKKYQSKGNPSRQSLSSRSMAITGIVILVFLVIHINHFKFGDTEMIRLGGEQARDLKSLVIDTFKQPLWAFGYTAVMMLLGVHLGHGFWSAFTSLTMKDKRYSEIVYAVGIVFAVVMAVGFLFIPMYIYFTGGQGALIQY